MTTFVRVSVPTGEVTVSVEYAEAKGLDVIDAPATDLRGRPLPASRKNGRPRKPRTTVNKEAAKKAVSQAATSPVAEPNHVGVADTTPEEAP